MLKRLFVDNYKCYTNFEIRFEELNLIMGNNGSGKSTLFELLGKVQALVSQGVKVHSQFQSSDKTRWQSLELQQFEVEIEGNDGLYKYEFAIQYQDSRDGVRLHYERLWYNARPLLKVGLNTAQLYEVQMYRDDHSAGPLFPYDWSQSALSSIPSRHDNTKLTWFREQIARMLIVRISATVMDSESKQETEQLEQDAYNFVSWFQFISGDQGLLFDITQELQQILDGFKNFKLEKVSEQSKVLKLAFSHEENRRKTLDYRFDELSAGQRALIVLYTLLYYAKLHNLTLCIDEPENFLGLSEIQPWLTLVYDFCMEEGVQALIISHHPKLINYLANQRGIWFERPNNGATRTQRISEETEGGISIADLVDRGWIYAE